MIEAIQAAETALAQASRLAAADDREAPEPLLVAERLHQERLERRAHFSPDLLGEPAWDILLALFIAGEQGRQMNVSQTWAAADLPSATGVRLLDKLEQQSLISRSPGNDRRQQHIQLTGTARGRMISYLMSIG